MPPSAIGKPHKPGRMNTMWTGGCFGIAKGTVRHTAHYEFQTTKMLVRRVS